MKLCIVMPAYNEEERIGKTLKEFSDFFEEKKKNKKLDFEILIVINNTTDKTEEIVKKAEKNCREIRHLSFKQGGKGFAIMQGFRDALKRKNDLIGFVDADLATSPEAFYDLVEKMNGDGAIASRWMKDAVIKTKQTLMRRVMSSGFNFIIRSLFMFTYRDTQCGAKVFKREAIERVIDRIGTTKWAFDIDLLYWLRREGFKINEIPTVWEDKAGSKLNLKKVPVQMFSAAVRLRLKYSPFRFVVRFYDRVLPERVKMHNL